MTDDFFRARLNGMIDLRHVPAVLAQRLAWSRTEQALAPCFARQARPEQWQTSGDLFNATSQLWAPASATQAAHAQLFVERSVDAPSLVAAPDDVVSSIAVCTALSKVREHAHAKALDEYAELCRVPRTQMEELAREFTSFEMATPCA